MEILGYGAILVMGLALGLTGGGGSILTVPIFVYLFGFSAGLATSYSLFVVVVCAGIGGILQKRKQNLSLAPVFLFGIPSMLGVNISRTWILPLVSERMQAVPHLTIARDNVILIAFAVLMILSSLSMIRKASFKEKSAKQSQVGVFLLLTLLGLGVGMIAGFVWAGGGFLIVPALVIVGRVPMKVAVGTSLLVTALQSLSAFAGDLLRQVKVDWYFLFLFLILSLVGIILGTMLSSKVSESKLKTIFRWFVLVMGFAIAIANHEIVPVSSLKEDRGRR